MSNNSGYHAEGEDSDSDDECILEPLFPNWCSSKMAMLSHSQRSIKSNIVSIIPKDVNTAIDDENSKCTETSKPPPKIDHERLICELEKEGSDEEELLKPFLSSDSKRLQSMSPTACIFGGSSRFPVSTSFSTSSNNNMSKSNNEHENRQKAKTPPPPPPPAAAASASVEKLEQKALARIEAVPDLISWARDSDFNLQNLKWYTSSGRNKNKSQVQRFPCRIARNHESIGLTLPKQRDNQVLVQFIGYLYSSFAEYQYVPLTHLEPLMDPVSQTIAAENMTSYVKTLKIAKKFHNDNASSSFNLILERVILEQIVVVCLKEQKRRETEMENTRNISTSQGGSADTDGNDSGNDDEDYDNKDQKDVDSGSKMQDGFEHLEQPPNNSSKFPTTKEGPAKESDTVAVHDMFATPKRQTISAGCIVQYNPPMSIGFTDIRTATVKIVNPKAIFVIELSDGQMLRKEDLCKLDKKVYRGKLVPNEPSSFLVVRKYRLKTTTDGSVSRCAFTQKVKQMKNVLQVAKDEITSHSATGMLSDQIMYNRKRGSKRRRVPASSTAATKTTKVSTLKRKEAKRDTSSIPTSKTMDATEEDDKKHPASAPDSTPDGKCANTAIVLSSDSDTSDEK